MVVERNNYTVLLYRRSTEGYNQPISQALPVIFCIIHFKVSYHRMLFGIRVVDV
jgi:hypothetical protein